MQNLRTPDQLRYWLMAQIIDGTEAAQIVHLIGDSLNNEEWSLLALVAKTAGLGIELKRRGSGYYLLKSDQDFEAKWKIRLRVGMPRRAFARISAEIYPAG